jgi:hypothetical protein
MANTTFTGPVRSENGFQTITKNASTGAVSVTSTIGPALSVTTVSATGNVTADSGTAPTAGGMLGVQISSTAGLGIYVGSGAPTISAAQGSIYLRTDGSSTSTRLYVNTNGTTGWTNVTTAT